MIKHSKRKFKDQQKSAVTQHPQAVKELTHSARCSFYWIIKLLHNLPGNLHMDILKLYIITRLFDLLQGGITQ